MVDFNHNAPVSCGAVGSGFHMYAINAIDTLLPISVPCMVCKKMEANFYTSDYNAAYCSDLCFKKE